MAKSNKLLGKLLLDIFKTLPPKAQGVILLGLFGVIGLVIVVNTASNKRNDPVPVVKSTPLFDPNDPERTCRWVVASSLRAREITRDVSRYKGTNSLRTDRDAQAEKAQAEYDAVLQTKVGTRIVWPVIVEWVQQDEVEVKNAFAAVDQDGIRADVYLRYREFAEGRAAYRLSGKLKIGTSITLEQAKQLDRDSWLFVEGMIESIHGGIGSYPSYGPETGSVSIDVKDCKAVLADVAK